MIKEIKSKLFKLKNDKYKTFSSSLLPDINNILGVNIPTLRKIAKEIYNSNYKIFFDENTDEFFELTMLEGIIIGLLKNKDEIYYRIQKFIPKINNWSICDSFCSSLKFIKSNKEEVKKFIEKYSSSNNEFELRFYYVILTMYFIDDDYNYVIDKIKKYKTNKYYANMSVSWCLSICIIKKFDRCIKNIQKIKIDKNIINCALQKALDSYRLTKKQKEIIRNIKNNLN